MYFEDNDNENCCATYAAPHSHSLKLTSQMKNKWSASKLTDYHPLI
jgi:hypothetical protein